MYGSRRASVRGMLGDTAGRGSGAESSNETGRASSAARSAAESAARSPARSSSEMQKRLRVTLKAFRVASATGLRRAPVSRGARVLFFEERFYLRLEMLASVIELAPSIVDTGSLFAESIEELDGFDEVV